MEVKAPEWMWLDTQRNVDQQELAQLCALNAAEIDELVARGVLVPIVAGAGRLFNAAVVPTLRAVVQQRAELDLDLPTMSVLLRYLLRIAQLEQQLRALQAPQSQYTYRVHLERDGPAPWREPHA